MQTIPSIAQCKLIIALLEVLKLIKPHFPIWEESKACLCCGVFEKLTKEEAEKLLDIDDWYAGRLVGTRVGKEEGGLLWGNFFNTKLKEFFPNFIAKDDFFSTFKLNEAGEIVCTTSAGKEVNVPIS